MEEKMSTALTASDGADMGTSTSFVSRAVPAPTLRAASRWLSSTARKAPSSSSAASPRCFQASATAMPVHEPARPGAHGERNTRRAWPTTTNGTKSGTLSRNSTGPNARARSQPHPGMATAIVSGDALEEQLAALRADQRQDAVGIHARVPAEALDDGPGLHLGRRDVVDVAHGGLAAGRLARDHEVEGIDRQPRRGQHGGDRGIHASLVLPGHELVDPHRAHGDLAAVERV